MGDDLRSAGESIPRLYTSLIAAHQSGAPPDCMGCAFIRSMPPLFGSTGRGLIVGRFGVDPVDNELNLFRGQFIAARRHFPRDDHLR